MNVGEQSTIIFLFWLVFFLLLFWTVTTPKSGNILKIPPVISSGSIIKLKHVASDKYLSSTCEPWILVPSSLISDPATHFIIQRQNGFISIQSVFTQGYLSSSLTQVPFPEFVFEFLFLQTEGILIRSNNEYLTISNLESCGYSTLSKIPFSNEAELKWNIIDI